MSPTEVCVFQGCACWFGNHWPTFSAQTFPAIHRLTFPTLSVAVRKLNYFAGSPQPGTHSNVDDACQRKKVSQQIGVHRDSCSVLLGSHEKRTACLYKLKGVLELAERITRLHGAENTLHYISDFKIEKVSQQNKK